MWGICRAVPQPHPQLFKRVAQGTARRGTVVMQRECTSRSSTAASTAAVPSSVACQAQAMAASCRLWGLGFTADATAADAAAGALPTRYEKARQASRRINIDREPFPLATTHHGTGLQTRL